MHIDWSAFGAVFVVSFGVAVGMIVLFAVGVSLLSGPSAPPRDTRLVLARTDGATQRTPSARARPDLARQLTAWACFLACALCVAYGLAVIVRR